MDHRVAINGLLFPGERKVMIVGSYTEVFGHYLELIDIYTCIDCSPVIIFKG